MRKNNLLGDQQRGRNLNWRQQDDQILKDEPIKIGNDDEIWRSDSHQENQVIDENVKKDLQNMCKKKKTYKLGGRHLVRIPCYPK